MAACTQNESKAQIGSGKRMHTEQLLQPEAQGHVYTKEKGSDSVRTGWDEHPRVHSLLPRLQLHSLSLSLTHTHTHPLPSFQNGSHGSHKPDFNHRMKTEWHGYTQARVQPQLATGANEILHQH